MHLKTITLFAGLCAVSACGGGGSSATSSGFDSFAGFLPSTILDNQIDNGLIGPAGEIGYAIGFAPGSTLEARAVSGVQSENVGATGTGTATFVGLYAFGVMEDVALTDTQITAVPGEFAGDIFLDVNFATGSLTGTGSSGGGAFPSDIVVNAGIAGRSLSGGVDVNYTDPDGAPAFLATTLDGFVGQDGAVGVFHGSDADTALAGGFVAQ